VKAILSATALVLALAGPLFAQTPYPYDPVADVGTYELQSYHWTDVDSINLATGNLSLHAPLISCPQRGGKLKLDYSITYSNGTLVQFKAPDNGPGQWNSGAVVITVPAPGPVNGTNFNNIAIVDDNFPKLSFSTSTSGTDYRASQAFIHESNGSSDPAGFINATQMRALDSSGFLATSTRDGGYVIVDPDGITTTNGNTAVDANGNQMILSLTGSFVGITDTMGRKIPMFYNIGQSWSVPGVNGGAANFVTTASGTTATVTLPNETGYTFQFTNMPLPVLFRQTEAQTYGVLTKVVLPTGGVITYTYASTPTQSPCVGPHFYFPVLTRSVDPNDGTGPKTWAYSYNLSADITTVIDPFGDKTVHTFGLNPCLAPYETQTQYFDNAENLLKTVSTAYSYVNVSGDAYQLFNVLPTSVTTTWPNGQAQQVLYTHDRDNGYSFRFGLFLTTIGITLNGTPSGYTTKPWTTTETDFGGSRLRQTKTTYVAFSGPNASSYLANNLLSLPNSVQTLNGLGYKCAEVDYVYDVPAYLVASGITEKHAGAPNSFRGNLSSVVNQLSSTPCQSSGAWTSLSSFRYAYDTGTTQKTLDALGNPTTYSYSPTYYGAYPTTITNALNQTTTYVYDFDMGLVTSTTDPDGQTTSYAYDEMLRPTTVTYPPGGGATIYNYSDAVGSLSYTENQEMSSSMSLQHKWTLDGLGRVTSMELWDPCGNYFTSYTYDVIGRQSTISNPYRTSQPCSPSVPSDTTSGTTTYLYDPLSRVTMVTEPDGSMVQTSYTGSATEVTDEGNGTKPVQRISQTDGLGRLTSVCEVSSTTLGFGASPAPASCGQQIGGSGFLTTYQYDALNNLLSVSQLGLNSRSFSYDSLSRLTSSTNPESGTITYGYDANGNLTSRVGNGKPAIDPGRHELRELHEHAVRR